jgi:hypothetical protein
VIVILLWKSTTLRGLARSGHAPQPESGANHKLITLTLAHPLLLLERGARLRLSCRHHAGDF